MADAFWMVMGWLWAVALAYHRSALWWAGACIR